MEKNYYINKYGRKVFYGQELENLVVNEISLVDFPATRKEFMVIKGGEQEMDEEKELKGWEDVSEKELSVIRETIAILRKYDLGNDLRRAEGTLSKYFGEKEVGEEEVKKYDGTKCEWSTVQRQLYNGFCEDDLSFINENIEVEKGSPDDKWPSLSGQFNLNQRRLEKAYEGYAVEERAI